MKYLIILIVALGLAVVLGYYVSDDAGFVVIGYAGKVFRTSFVFFVFLLAAVIIAVYLSACFLYRILTLRTRLVGWSGDYSRNRAQRALGEGLLALAGGDFRRAERLLRRGGGDETATAVRYLGAAEAAQAQNAVGRRDNYLHLAQGALPAAEMAVGIKKVEMQVASDQYKQARVTLDYLSDQHFCNEKILALQESLYVQTKDFEALLDLLPALRRHTNFTPARLASLELKTAIALLSKPRFHVDDIHEIWRQLPKSCRGHAKCIALYAGRLAALGQHEEAEILLRKHIGHEWHPELIYQYGEVRTAKVLQQMQRAEVWLATRTKDPNLLLTVAKLCTKAEQWDKAQRYLDRLVALAPSPAAYWLLAEVFGQSDDLESVNQCLREGLRLATDDADVARELSV